jgi:hypothetical protein
MPSTPNSFGIYKTSDDFIYVSYGESSFPIPRATYELRGYKPALDLLPTKEEYLALTSWRMGS